LLTGRPKAKSVSSDLGPAGGSIPRPQLKAES